MSPRFADRMSTVHRSFIREILKVTQDPEVISFAGGLPNPELFPVKALQKAAHDVLGNSDATGALQYSTTDGIPRLREWIADRYKAKYGLDISPDQLIVTTGSQQCLDLVGKVFLDKGDTVIMERPGYLGAIQSFSIFEPAFIPVDLEDDGPDLAALEQALDGKNGRDKAGLFYAVTSFQNPSGLTYGAAKRKAVAELLAGRDTVFVEDNPYGELRFSGQDLPPVAPALGDKGLLLGSFSKIATPGFRLGWIVASGETRDKLIIAKQASDLHTSTLTQHILHRYLTDNDIDEHIALIKDRYGRQRDVMVQAIGEHFPESVRATSPEGGMFLWATLPEGASTMDLFDMAIKDMVAFVPGKPFYVDGTGLNTMRLNFSNSSEERIQEGIKRLGRCIKEYLGA